MEFLKFTEHMFLEITKQSLNFNKLQIIPCMCLNSQHKLKFCQDYRFLLASKMKLNFDNCIRSYQELVTKFCLIETVPCFDSLWSGFALALVVPFHDRVSFSFFFFPFSWLAVQSILYLEHKDDPCLVVIDNHSGNMLMIQLSQGSYLRNSNHF